MKIASSSISMRGNSSFLEKSFSEERLKMWTGSKAPDFQNQGTLFSQQNSSESVILNLSDQAKHSQNVNLEEVSPAEDDITEIDISDEDKQKLIMIQQMIESLSGKKIKFLLPKKISIHNFKKLELDFNSRARNSTTLEKLGWGLEYDYLETQYQHEKMSFSSTGSVKTTDGKEINFSIALSMDREFALQNSISIRAGDAVKVDPLVINFSNTSVSLTDAKYSFDLDSDGNNEQISFLTPGSGFLALDLNNDNITNNGSELFGTKSNDGFKDLSVYDSDGNNWIDENDPIYDKLRIWTKDSSGQDTLFALGEKGIGAIYLGNVSTEFSVKDSQNKQNGQIRKTGIFLNEDGTSGTIQHIDIVI